MSDTVQQIKDTLSIVDVVGQYVKLERAGSNFRAKCPFHSERTPSFFVSPDRGTYHCFGCNVGGDIFTFIQEIEGLDFRGALKILADKAGVPIEYEKRGARDERARLYTLLETATLFYIRQLKNEHMQYLKERGLTEKTAQAFRIGFAPSAWQGAVDYLREKGFIDTEIEMAGIAKKGEKGLYDRFRNRIMFPIMDSAGRVVAFSGRIAPDEKSEKAAKYINSPETALFKKSRILYGYDRAKQYLRKYNFALLVEGQMDLIASHQAGWTNTVAVCGTALTPEHTAVLRRQTSNIVIALDADSAGFTAAMRSARIALSADMDVKVARLPEEFDPADVIQKKGKETWGALVRESKHIISFLLDVLERDAKDARAFQRRVEEMVLPFVHDTSNPIDKEKYIQQIAGRLGASEQAIQNALARTPAHDDYGSVPPSQENEPLRQNKERSRVHQLWGILLWQKALQKPRIDVKRLEKRVRDAISKDDDRALSKLEKHEEEQFRFAAEALYADDTRLEREIDELMKVVRAECIQRQLEGATAELRRAEQEGDEKRIAKALKKCTQFTQALAKNGEIV